MVTVKVVKSFFDMGRKCDRKPGDTFLATEGRALQILDRLPGYVEWDGMPADEEEVVVEDVIEEKPAEIPEPEPEPVEDVIEEEPTVGPGPEPVEDVVEDEPVDYEKLTNAELKALCKERGIDVPQRAKKAELVALLKG